MHTRAWVDFNAIADGRCVTLRKYVEGGVVPGEQVTAFDAEGLACDGTVESIDGDLVTIMIDMDTCREERALRRIPQAV
jgi:hypothetical protein